MIAKERINEGSKEKGEEKDKNDQYIHPDPKTNLYPPLFKHIVEYSHY